MARARARGQRWRLDLPALEDMYSVQVALMRVIEALADDQIDNRRAGLILYGLQQAATNLRDANAWGEDCHRFEVADDTGGLAEEYDYMEAEFGLPEDTEVDVSEGWAFPTPEAVDVARESSLSENARDREEDAAIPVRAHAMMKNAHQSVTSADGVASKKPSGSAAAEETAVTKSASQSASPDRSGVPKKPAESVNASHGHEVTPREKRA